MKQTRSNESSPQKSTHAAGNTSGLERVKQIVKSLEACTQNRNKEVDFDQIVKLFAELTTFLPNILNQMNPKLRKQFSEMVEDLADYHRENNSVEDLHLFKPQLLAMLKNLQAGLKF